MKKVTLAFLISVFTLTVVTSSAQNKTFGIGTSTLNPNAALQVDASNQGLQLPRLTTTQRTAMTLDPVIDKGLMVFDTDLNSIHTWDGTKWSNETIAQRLVLPYKDSTSQNLSPGARLLALKYKGTSNAGVAQFQNYSVTNTYPVVAGLQLGLGFAGSFVVNNPADGGTALSGSTNSNKGGTLAPVGVYGESTGTGSVGGAFWSTNPANTYPALHARTLGAGNAATFLIENAANPSAAITAQTNGTGSAARFENTNSSSVQPLVYAAMTSNSSNAAMEVISGGTSGHAGVFNIFNLSNPSPALFSYTNGTGPTLQIHQASNGNALEVGAGGIKLSTTTISTGGTISGLTAIYNITTNASVTLPIATNGQVCWVFNGSGGIIDLTDAGLVEPAAGKFAQYIYIGQWRPME